MRRLKGKGFYGCDTFKYLNPTETGYEYCTPGQSYTAVRDYLLLHYVVSGRGEYFSGGEKYEVGAGEMFIIHPGEFNTYKADKEDPWHYVWIGFTVEFDLPEILTTNYVIGAAEYAPVFKKIEATVSAGNFDDAEIYGLIWELLGRIRYATVTRGRNPYETVRIAEHFIELHYSGKITVEGIAEMLNIDRSYLYVIFKKYNGRSPQQHINRYRLEKAKEFLADGMPPGKVAIACGYSDVFIFSKMFKREFGISPAKYQKENSGIK